MNTATQRKGFTFYRSYQEAIEMLPMEDQLAVYKAIANYSLDGSEPSEGDLSLYGRLLWIAFLPNLQADRNRYSNASKGGAPKGNSNARRGTLQEEPQNNRETTEKQPKNNQKTTKNNRETTNVNVDVNEKENVEEKVNENENVDVDVDVNVNENVEVEADVDTSAPPLTHEELVLVGFNNWCLEYTPTLLQFAEPMTAAQIASLRQKYSDSQIKECAAQMHNKNAFQNNRSAYLTMRKWIKTTKK